MPAMIRTAVALSAGQAAGTTAILAANPNRTSLTIGNDTATDAKVDVVDASGGYGMPLPTKGVLGFGGRGGPICPTDAIFIMGLAAGDKVTIWEC
jgi:hypothetical protein